MLAVRVEGERAAERGRHRAPTSPASALPSGPARWYASVIHVSLWMLLFGFLAMNGFCGGLVVLRTGLPLNACPEKAGSEGGGGTDGIDTADALPAVTASATVAIEITPQTRATGAP